MKKGTSVLAKVFALVLSFTLFMGLFTGCNKKDNVADTGAGDTSGGSTSDGNISELTFTAWANTGEIAVLQKAVDEYNKMQNNVKVIFQNAPGEGYEQKLITSLAGKTAADVFYAGDSTIAKLISNGTVAELTDFLESDKSYVKADEFADGLWGAARTEDGKIYGLTVDCNPYLLYYSPAMFKQLGIKSPQEYFEEGNWTWDTFDETLTALQKAGKKGYLLDGDPSVLYRFIASNGGAIWDGETFKLNDKAVEALQYCADRLEDGRFVYSGTLPKGQGSDASFMSGQAGYVSAGRWFTPTFHEAGVDFDYIPYPSQTGEQYPPTHVATSYMAVNANSDMLEEAMKFASYYCSKEGQSVRVSGVGNSIPSISGIDDPVRESGIPEHVEHIFELRNTGWALGSEYARDAVYPGMLEELRSVLEEIYVSGKSVEEVVPRLEAAANKVVSERG